MTTSTAFFIAMSCLSMSAERRLRTCSTSMLYSEARSLISFSISSSEASNPSALAIASITRLVLTRFVSVSFVLFVKVFFSCTSQLEVHFWRDTLTLHVAHEFVHSTVHFVMYHFFWQFNDFSVSNC